MGLICGFLHICCDLFGLSKPSTQKFPIIISPLPWQFFGFYSHLFFSASSSAECHPTMVSSLLSYAIYVCTPTMYYIDCVVDINLYTIWVIHVFSVSDFFCFCHNVYFFVGPKLNFTTELTKWRRKKKQRKKYELEYIAIYRILRRQNMRDIERKEDDKFGTSRAFAGGLVFALAMHVCAR